MKRALSRRDFKRRPPTPPNLGVKGSTDGLVLRVGVEGMAVAQVARLAKRIVAEVLPGKWIVQRMGAESRDFAVRRPVGSRNPSAGQAFDYSYRLREHRDVEDCEPALVLPVNGPAALRPLPQTARSNSSIAGGADLPCTSSVLWAHKLCRVQQAWQLTPPQGGRSHGEGVVIGHPDTGYTDHPEIADASRLLKASGFDFEDGDRDARDTQVGFSAGHGTSTASVIMSVVDASLGVTGIAPRAKLVPLRVTTNVVLLSFDKLAEAIRFAADSGHHVISISLGGPIHSRFLHRAVTHAVSLGVIVVCAAGNVWPFVVYPARLDEVIAVAACNCDRRPWDDSASGSAVDITAPGESVWRATVSGTSFEVGRGSGTSYSTAVVAGAAALWLAHHGRANLVARYGRQNLASAFKEVLLRSGFDRPTSWDTGRFGAGILNAQKLLSAPLPSTPPAGGMHALHASAAPRSKNHVDEIIDLFPDERPEDVRAAMSRLLGVPDIELAATLRDVGDEIAYLAATDMEFRSMFVPGRQKAHARAATEQGRPVRLRMSRRLRQMSATSAKT